MTRRSVHTLTPLELEIMQVIWKRGEVTVKDISDELKRARRPLALPSIRTMLGILLEKGFVQRRPFGRGHAYAALQSVEHTRGSILSDIIDRVFEGSTRSLVAALVRGDLVSRRELDEARRLIEAKKKGGKK